MNNSYGCKLSPVDLRDYKIKASAVVALPDEFELKFEHHIKDQGRVSSCVAHATSEILEYYSKENMSTNFIYSTRKKLYNDDGPGMHLIDACKTVQKYGDMLEVDCPGNIECPECFEYANEMLADKEKLNKAYYYRIDSYYKCSTESDIKCAIMNYGPVLGAVKWYNRISYRDKKLIFDTTADFGYHAIMIYGWTKDGWLIQNSWGIGFGYKGCVVLPYEYKIEEARCLIDHDNSKDTKDTALVIPNANSHACIDTAYKTLNRLINLVLRR